MAYNSTLEVCKILGIDHKTYCEKEGKLFPVAKRQPNGFRIFTEDDVDVIRRAWQERSPHQ
jgi:DNA-binding transcriptional MerR regulator